MGKRGPKPTPTALRIAQGTFRRDRHGHPDSQPDFPLVASTDPPGTLGAAGRERWSAVVPSLVATGVLTVGDVAALELYCRSFDEVARLDALLADAGEFIATKTGFVAPHPAVNQRFKWLDLQRRLASEFALTPASRTTVKVTPTTSTRIKPRKRN